tara:strand:+ start:577 stop:1083 length:507 start_codon:yes stop_codon:yes gene_type:complete
MASIYEIPSWNNGTWSLNNIVIHGGRYYYNTNECSNCTPALHSSEWGGWSQFGNAWVPHFFWVPSYAPSISSEPKVKSVKFGDGYEQRTPEHISSSLISLSLAFDKRSEEEATAIAHFLHTRGAHEAFVFTPPSPYGSAKKFICKKWDTSVEFEGSYSVKATFEEVVE